MIRAVVVLAFLIGGCASQLTTDKILGKWTVSDVACMQCEGRTPAERGTVLDLSASRVVNPLYGNCETRPGFDLLKTVDSRTLLDGTGTAWPARVRAAVGGSKSLLHGFVTCDGINYAQVAFVSPKEGYYFFEGGVVFVLGR